MLLLLVVLAADVPPLPKHESTTLTVKQKKAPGYTYFAEECHVATDAGTVRLPGRGLPFVEHVLEIDGGWLLVGSQSTGVPLAHTLRVVKAPGTLGQVLQWFTIRSEPCVLLEKTAMGWRVGLPKTGNAATLRIGADVKPTFEDFVATATTWSYCPPKQLPMPAPTRVAWYLISANGFQPAAK